MHSCVSTPLKPLRWCASTGCPTPQGQPGLSTSMQATCCEASSSVCCPVTMLSVWKPEQCCLNHRHTPGHVRSCSSGPMHVLLELCCCPQRRAESRPPLCAAQPVARGASERPGHQHPPAGGALHKPSQRGDACLWHVRGGRCSRRACTGASSWAADSCLTALIGRSLRPGQAQGPAVC